MARKVKILLLIPHLGGGGAEKVTALLARGLSREKYEVHVSLITQANAGADAVPPWVTVHALGARRVRSGAWRLLRLVGQLQPDVTLSGIAHLNFLVLLLRPFFPRKTHVLVRQSGTVSSDLAAASLPWYTPLLYRLLYRRADRIVCQSRAMADDLERELGLRKDLIAVLPNPVDFDGIRTAIRASDPCPDPWRGPGPHLLAIGRLAPEKGFDLLLRALAVVRQRFPHAELIVAGTGPEETALKALRRSLGLDAAVHFPGHLESPYVLYPGASLYVLASRREGMPNALLEAAAGDLPIVATPASGGVVDLLRSLRGAWLARETSSNALAAALLEALSALGPGQRFERSFSPALGPSAARPAVRGIAGASISAAACGEFAFGSAISGYEELIDSTCASRASHVAFVIPTLDRIGGAERQVILLAKGLHERGWRVTVVTLSGSCSAGSAELDRAGVSFLSLAMRKGLADPRGWVRFIGWLRRERPDVVHAHLPHAAWLARWSRLCAPIPVLVDTLHSSSTGTVGRRLGYRLSRGLPDQVTAVSRSVADSHLAAGMVTRRTLTVLHNGVDVKEWRPDEHARTAVRRELGLEDEFLWLAAGRLETVKDYPTLLQAMTAVPPPAQLVIAGGGPLLRDLGQLASDLGLEARVRFLGFVPDVRRWFQAADGFVLTSRWEGLPMALLEAGACGLPAVATDVAGSREAILGGETGTLVPPMDSAALAGAMSAMMEAPLEERRAMGERARLRVSEQFSLAASIGHCEKLYGDLLGSKSQRAALHQAASNAASASASSENPSLGDATLGNATLRDAGLRDASLGDN